MKNITIRNLAGGFLGGFLGILSGGLIHPIAIPLGCVIGVMVGFWFKEIKLAITGTLQKMAFTLKTDIDIGFVLIRVQSFGNGVQRWARYHRLTWMRDLRRATRFGYWCISALGWLLLSPFRFAKLCLGHPVMVARTIRALTIICTTVIVLILSYSFYPDVDEIGRYLLVLSWSVVATMFSFFGSEGLIEDGTSNLSAFFHNWSRYSRRGPVFHIATSMMQHLIAMVAIAVMLLTTFFVIFGGIFFMMLFFVVSVLMNALWIASSRHEHLLCVAVTLIITITSAIVYANHMHGVSLWLVALTTGVLSGLLTEAIRRVIVFAFNNTLLYKFLGDVIGDPGRPEELKFGVTKRFWKWIETLFDSFGQKLNWVMSV